MMIVVVVTAVVYYSADKDDDDKVADDDDDDQLMYRSTQSGTVLHRRPSTIILLHHTLLIIIDNSTIVWRKHDSVILLLVRLSFTSFAGRSSSETLCLLQFGSDIRRKLDVVSSSLCPRHTATPAVLGCRLEIEPRWRRNAVYLLLALLAVVCIFFLLVSPNIQFDSMKEEEEEGKN